MASNTPVSPLTAQQMHQLMQQQQQQANAQYQNALTNIAMQAPWTNTVTTGTMWPNPHSHTLGGYTNQLGGHTHTISAPRPQPFWTKIKSREAKALQALNKAMLDLKIREVTATASANTWNISVPPHIVIEHLGKLRPIHAGRPKMGIVTQMLSIGASPKSMRGGYNLFMFGLAHKLPHIIGKRKTRFTLSATGLALLDHYATKFPSFKRFVDAYVPAKRRKEIMAMSVDFEIGQTPALIDELLVRHKLEQERLTQLEKQSLIDRKSVV